MALSWASELRLRQSAGADPFTMRYLTCFAVAAATLLLVLVMISRLRGKDGADATKILLLSSNGRSGSTYLSELLTAEDAVNFFEPLRWLKDTPSLSWEELSHAEAKSSWRRPKMPLFISLEEKMRMISSLFDCRIEEYEDLLLSDQARPELFRRFFPRSQHKRKGLDQYKSKCKASNVRLVKTFRLHLDELAKYGKSGGMKDLEGVHVVHLVRDPRGVLKSMIKVPAYKTGGKDWRDHNFSKICRHILRDLAAVGALRQLGVPVLLVRYEDLVDDAAWQVSEVVRFLERGDLFEAMMAEVRAHVRGGEEETDEGRTDYYNTFRPQWFTHDEWKEELPGTVLNKLQEDEDCAQAMKIMEYEKV